MKQPIHRRDDALSILGKDFEDLIDELEEKERLERRKSYADQLVMKSFTPRELARATVGLPMHEPRRKGIPVEVLIDLPSEPFEQGPALLLKSRCARVRQIANVSSGLPRFGSDAQILRDTAPRGLSAKSLARMSCGIALPRLKMIADRRGEPLL